MSKVDQSAEKKCFVVMPISDNPEYPSGHFDRVYKHLICPAVVSAGYFPERADGNLNTDCIPIQIIKDIINADLVVCDMSSKNPNVMYELGLRHAFDNKPTVLIKDNKTGAIFDVETLRYMPYDAALRIDAVTKSVEDLKEFIKNTVENFDDGLNSLVRLANFISPKLNSSLTEEKISNDSVIILNELRGLSEKINKINQIDAPSGVIRPLEKIDEFNVNSSPVLMVTLPENNEIISVGRVIFDRNDKDLGVVKSIDVNKNMITVRKREKGGIYIRTFTLFGQGYKSSRQA
jgi:hypothetical protein